MINQKKPILRIQPEIPIFDTVLVDVNCIAHLAYNQYDGDDNDLENMKEYIGNLLDLYFKFPFLKTKSYIVFGDAPPYWRSRTLSRNCGTVYKGTRSERSDGKKRFLKLFAKMANALTKSHYEADDLITEYIRTHPLENICILTVDSDLLQLAKDNVTWFCCKGFYPQIRSESNGNLQIWLDNKFKKLSKKRIGHLDTSKASTIIDWKVIYGDASDNIPAGEESRPLIDLNYDLKDLALNTNHPEFYLECESRRVLVTPLDRPLTAIKNYETDNMYTWITKIPDPKDWSVHASVHQLI